MLRVIGIGQSLAEVLVAEDAAAVVGRSSAFTGHETGVGSPVDGLGDCLQGEHMEPAVAEVVGVLELIALGPQHLVQRDLCSGCVSSPAWICPEGAACMAAARQLRESGWIGEGVPRACSGSRPGCLIARSVVK